MDPITANISALSGNPTLSDPATGQAKSGPSKFDQVLSKLGATPDANAVDSGSPTQAISGPQPIQKAEPARVGPAQQAPNSISSLSATLATSREQLNQLQDRVQAAAKSSSMGALGNRLIAVEDQYKQLDSLLRGVGSSGDPQKLLQLQESIYRLNENIGIVAKIVDQVTAGIKSIQQIQI